MHAKVKDPVMSRKWRDEATNAAASGDSHVDGASNELSQVDEHKAAAVIQRNYRGYRERRQMKGLGMSASARWSDAISELRYRENTRPMSREHALAAGDAHARAKLNWRRFSTIANRAAADDSDDDSDDADEDGVCRQRKRVQIKSDRAKHAKQMDLPYWLEMVDEKHRYGSHLRTYHEVWQQADTHENFFYWLDYGAGKQVDLPIVSRQKLDADRVRYLSREERQNYRVRIDNEGRLCWAHNGIRITTSTAYKDSVDGIVPQDDLQHRPWAMPTEVSGAFSSDESDTMSTGHIDDDEAQHYVNHDLTRAKGLKKLKHVSATTILNLLLQKTVKPNSWIFVADTSFRLYVGIKQSGSFQHSSFLHGSRISAAGLIKIKEGQLRKLSPLSGHYRPPTKNFRFFVHSLKDAGVDMSRVSISKSYAILLGLEAYITTSRTVKRGIRHIEDGAEKVMHPEEAKSRKQAQVDMSESAKKEREVLAKQENNNKEHKRETSFSHRFMERVRSRTSSGYIGNGPNERHKASQSSEHEHAESGIQPQGKR